MVTFFLINTFQYVSGFEHQSHACNFARLGRLVLPAMSNGSKEEKDKNYGLLVMLINKLTQNLFFFFLIHGFLLYAGISSLVYLSVSFLIVIPGDFLRRIILAWKNTITNNSN